jgi:hypothetical protein
MTAVDPARLGKRICFKREGRFVFSPIPNRHTSFLQWTTCLFREARLSFCLLSEPLPPPLPLLEHHLSSSHLILSEKMTITSPRLKNQLRSVVTIRVMSMNLQGTGKFKGMFFNKQEIYTTVFVIEVKFGNFKWTTRKLFDECRQFLLTAQPYKEYEFQVSSL